MDDDKLSEVVTISRVPGSEDLLSSCETTNRSSDRIEALRIHNCLVELHENR